MFRWLIPGSERQEQDMDVGAGLSDYSGIRLYMHLLQERPRRQALFSACFEVKHRHREGVAGGNAGDGSLRGAVARRPSSASKVRGFLKDRQCLANDYRIYE